MKEDGRKTKAELLRELNSLRSRVKHLDQGGRESENYQDCVSDHIFQTIFHNMADGILVADVQDKKIHLANAKLCQMLGYSSEEIKHLGIADIHPEKDLQYVIEQFNRQVEGKITLAEDIPLKRIDGGILYVDVNAIPITLDGKKCLIGIFRDITDRRNTESELHQSQFKYRMLLENIPQKIFLKDKDSVYISCNENFARDLKIGSEDIVGKTDYDFFLRELAEKYRADDKRVMDSGETEEIEEKYLEQGKEIIVQTVKTPVKDKQGNVVGVLGIFWDITEQKKMEHSLQESEERYRSVVEDSPVLLCSFLPDGKITFVNTAYCEYFGKTSEELVGNNFKSLIPESDRQTIMDNILSLTVDTPTMTQEHKVVTPDGQVRWQRWTNRAIFDERGRAVCFQSFGEDITERKKTEEEVRKFKTIADRAGYGVVISDVQGNLLFVNESFAQMHGYQVDELNGRNLSIFHNKEQMETVNRLNKQLIEKGNYIAEEVWHCKKDGNIFCALMNGTLIRDDKGQPQLLACTAIDIAERKRMEDELFSEKNRFQSILEVMESFVTIRDLDYTVIYQNEYATKMLGNKIGEKCYSAYERKNSICEGCPVELAYKDGKSHISEREVMLPSGEIIYLENIANPMRDANGKIFACLEVSTDVTERKKAADALRESEEKYRTLVESAGEGIATIDDKGAFLFLNKTGTKRLGIGPEDYKGKTFWDLFPKRLADSQAEDVRKVINTGQGMNQFELTEIQGKPRWYNTTIEPLRDASGKVIAAMVLARDITEFKRTQQELDKYREEMTRAEQLASVGLLSATTAHELTQPLTVIRLLIENALAKLETTSSTKAVIEKLRDSLTEVSNITSVVDRLRSLARKSSGKNFIEVDLGAIASRIVNLLNESVQQHGFSLHLEGMGKLPHIYSSDRDIEQLFFSLIDNALQAGQGKQRLVIKGAVKDDYVELSFSDNCGGISPENLDRIFEPFFTTKPTGQGTGLGLCIVQDIVSRASGKVRVESKFGEGTTFFVTLPIYEDGR